MKPQQPAISDAEWEVMNVVWERSPITASEVVEALSGGDEAHSSRNPRTVKTMLNRLLKKGVLSHEAEGKRYLYRPTVSRDECVERESESFLSRVFAGEEAPMIAHLVRSADLSAAEIQRLRSALEEKAREQGQEDER